MPNFLIRSFLIKAPRIGRNCQIFRQAPKPIAMAAKSESFVI